MILLIKKSSFVLLNMIRTFVPQKYQRGGKPERKQLCPIIFSWGWLFTWSLTYGIVLNNKKIEIFFFQVFFYTTLRLNDKRRRKWKKIYSNLGSLNRKLFTGKEKNYNRLYIKCLYLVLADDVYSLVFKEPPVGGKGNSDFVAHLK